jgi:predicted glycosyltransferase
MADKRILFISGSAGLGHITRDLAIAKELRQLVPEVKVSWLAAPPTTRLIEEAGEELIPRPDLWADETAVADMMAEKQIARGKEYEGNVMEWVWQVRGVRKRNVRVFEEVMSKHRFHLVIGDEAFEVYYALSSKRSRVSMECPFVMIYDFIGLDAMTGNPLEKILVHMRNRMWAHRYKCFPSGIAHFFVGEPEDVPDRRFGLTLPNRRDWAKAHCAFLGYVVRFDPAEYSDRPKVRARLGYGEEPLVICSIGGTSAGQSLLRLCGQAFPIIRDEIPNVRMVLICGPRLSPESLEVPPGVEVRGYVSRLHEHFAASDLAVVMGTGTSTVELTALRRPFLYFPLEKHFEQQVHVGGRVSRHKAGVRMRYYETTPKLLAEQVISSLGTEVSYDPIPTDGAQKAAEIINELLS